MKTTQLTDEQLALINEWYQGQYAESSTAWIADSADEVLLLRDTLKALGVKPGESDAKIIAAVEGGKLLSEAKWLSGEPD